MTNPADSTTASHPPSLRASALWKQLPSVFAESFARTAYAHIPLYAVSGLFFVLSYVLLALYRLPMPLGSGLFFLSFVGELLLIWSLGQLLWDIWLFWRAGAPPGLAGLLAEKFVKRLMTGDRPGNSAHALIALTPMMIAFTAAKENIPVIHPFSWDKTFAQWDLALGFGRMPWEILQPLNHPAITITVNFFYHLWFFLMFGILIWQGFSFRTSALRLRYLLAFCFCWFFGGTVLAILFSSAGPCFYSDMFPGPSPFAGQMAYLNSVGPDWIWSLAVQRDLWTSYVTGSGAVKGISAMPSMHVSIAVLNAILCWKIDRRLGWAATGFAALIFLGSIILLWHYAVDGLVSIALTLLCWAAAGALAQRWTKQSNE